MACGIWGISTPDHNTCTPCAQHPVVKGFLSLGSAGQLVDPFEHECRALVPDSQSYSVHLYVLWQFHRPHLDTPVPVMEGGQLLLQEGQQGDFPSRHHDKLMTQPRNSTERRVLKACGHSQKRNVPVLCSRAGQKHGP